MLEETFDMKSINAELKMDTKRKFRPCLNLNDSFQVSFAMASITTYCSWQKFLETWPLIPNAFFHIIWRSLILSGLASVFTNRLETVAIALIYHFLLAQLRMHMWCTFPFTIKH